MNLGTLGYPDLVAEIADLLLAYDSARMVLCLGEYRENVYLSLRTEADNARAGAIMRHIVAHDGAAGGHGTMAGARLFAQIPSEAKLAETFQEMVRRLHRDAGASADARRTAPPGPAVPPRRSRLVRPAIGRTSSGMVRRATDA